MSEQVQEQEMPGEQAAELAALTAMAGEGQPQPGATTPEQEQQAPGVSLSQEIAGALAMMVGVVGPMFPSVKEIYTKEVCQAVGEAVEPVCIKHGWLADGIGGKYGEELMALMVVGPLAYATYVGVAGDIAARQKSSQVEKVTPLPLGQQVGPTPDVAPAEKGLVMGKVQPHENN
ncbi:hypothetical protein [Oxalicibacterium faecigallinarum]|uniref:Uncharacterized protein n=1 Tax=Oxalicibacterium faecigallinarum TaxID=573741 RepID=A0A8J3F4M3_9BURK|nr:hypothetical protein [Oxalicibacterium faecigallinarum]GGI16911.1 hypothetical protein GCM10008066_06330 [Oxalicibacterium faecigallinarum]